MPDLPFRIGMGIDVHRFAEGRKLILGGVEIPHTVGLDGHSDADALLHAITDAMLGALALGDIGQYFPNDDPQWKNRESSVFLRHSSSLVKERGYAIGNIDSCIITEKPKLLPHIISMREAVAAMLDISVEQVGIKAGTNEQMGFVGRGEGLAAHAVVLLVKT